MTRFVITVLGGLLIGTAIHFRLLPTTQACLDWLTRISIAQ